MKLELPESTTCFLCKKDFCICDKRNYAYKKQTNGTHKYFCSYSCMRKYENQQAKEKK